MSKTATLSFATPGALAGMLIFCSALAQGQVSTVPATPQAGSSNPATAEPAVPRPDTNPCTVTLFQNEAFDNYTPYVFNYAPPLNCPGPWSKVVFTGDFTVSEGRQYDRTASFYIGHANIYYGTTAEPRSTLSPSWHVERDVTDLTKIFESRQTGQADLGNFVGVSNGVTYNGVIYVTAQLQFYPASYFEPAPRTPDLVVPVNGSGGDAGTLNTTSDQITQMLNLPRNVEQVYLDVIAQSQSNDEFWYFCVPSNLSSNLQSCGNTAFRETEIYLDGKPAGVAPVSPWIFTGGIDPYLWEPITGVQTLEFKPYRVNLTPFAGVLNDGKPHTVAVSVFNANSYFLATANLLVYTDHGSSEVTGGLLKNTLDMAPSPDTQTSIQTQAGPAYTGFVNVTSNRAFIISGYTVTSHGRVETTVDQNVSFASEQQFKVSGSRDYQYVRQTSTVKALSTTQEGTLTSTSLQQYSFPLTLVYDYVVNPDNTASQTVKSLQSYRLLTTDALNGLHVFSSKSEEQVQSQDVLNFTSGGALSGPPVGSSSAYAIETDSLGHCYSRTINAADRKLTSVSDTLNCGK